MEIMSIEEITAMLQKQADLRSLENDEQGLLIETITLLEKGLKEIHGEPNDAG